MRALIPGILLAGGLVIVVTSFYPLSVADWLPRSIQLLIGCMALMLGAALVHFDTRETA